MNKDNSVMANSLSDKQSALKQRRLREKIVKAHGDNLQNMHAALVLGVQHTQLHGDARPLAATFAVILDIMPRQKQNLNTWLHAISPIRIVNPGTDKQKAGTLSPKAKAYRPYDLDEAERVPFWEMVQDESTRYVKPSSVVKFALEGARKRLLENPDGERVKLAAPTQVAEAILDKIEAVFADPAFLGKLEAQEKAFIAADKLACNE